MQVCRAIVSFTPWCFLALVIAGCLRVSWSSMVVQYNKEKLRDGVVEGQATEKDTGQTDEFPEHKTILQRVVDSLRKKSTTQRRVP